LEGIVLLFKISILIIILKAAPKFEQPRNKIGIISIDLPQTILITIETHGKGLFNGVLFVFI
jgi:hypothetical protein